MLGTVPMTDASQDQDAPRAYAVNLDEFEGPLDLLIHLVRRHELDVLNIPIAFVATKYMEYLDLARILDIDLAGDYLVMAATLAYLKSRELLPSDPLDDAHGDLEGGPDPRQALIARLVAYERFKFAAQAMDAMPQLGRDLFDRGVMPSLPRSDPGLAPVAMAKLWSAYEKVLDRARIRQDHQVVIEAVTVRQRMVQLGAVLGERESFDLAQMMLSREWFNRSELRAMLVVTLMSILELVKLGVVEVTQEEDTVHIQRRVEVEQMRRIIADFRGDDEDETDLALESGDQDSQEADVSGEQVDDDDDAQDGHLSGEQVDDDDTQPKGDPSA